MSLDGNLVEPLSPSSYWMEAPWVENVFPRVEGMIGGLWEMVWGDSKVLRDGKVR
jgi:hypothetical protein